MNSAGLAWRLLRRDLAAGEVRVLLAALVLAVTAVTSVGFLTHRAERALALEANRLLGGDAVLRADMPIAPALIALAQAPGLRHTQTRAFPSMLRAGERLRLAEVRALGGGFPLRGAFRLVDVAGGPERVAGAVPARGSAWLTRAGAEALGVAVGDTLKLGQSQFRLAALVVAEPDAALDYFNLAPRVFIALDDLAATGLVQEGSRISHRLVVAGDPAAVQRFVDGARATLGRGQRLETIADARPELRSALERGGRFLGLAALVAVVLAAVAIALAARRHAQRHLDGCAVMRCLGASQATIARVYGGELVGLGVIGCAIGLALAWTLQAAVGDWLALRLGLALPPADWRPLAEGAATGLLVLLGFALPPVLALRGVPTLRVLRRDVPGGSPRRWLATALGLAALVALVAWRADSLALAGTLLGGLAATLAVLALLALGFVALLRRVRARLRGPWRYGLANVSRRAASSIAQIAALGLGLLAMLLLTLVRTDLLAQWQQAMPADAPNRFVINVQADQVEPVRAVLREHGLVQAALVPLVRARLVAVNGAATTGASYADGRARRLAEREFNLSWAERLGTDNAIVAGRFWNEGAAASDASAELSIEEGIAQTLGWKLGDRLAFEIAGRRFEAAITSLRRVEWESFRPNFFVLARPGVLDGFAASWITSVHVPAGSSAMAQLVERFPNLSVIDLDAVMSQVRRTGEQVSTAVEAVFWFTLAAGVLVLLAAVVATRDERLLEGGVMRALGANSRQLLWGQVAEFAAIGLIAGLTAALAASLLSGLIATQVFDLPARLDWRLPALGAVLGAALVVVFGLAATRRVLSAPPAATLRALAG